MKNVVFTLVLSNVWIVQLWSCHGFMFSTTTRQRRQPHPPAAPSLEPVMDSRQARRSSAPLLFARYNGYVPDGMSPEEYLQMKKVEAARLKNKEFGAFGPRFLQTQRPTGDWFLTPTLWTSGFKSSSSKASRRMITNGEDHNDERGISPIFHRIKAFLKKYLPAMFLSYLAVDVGLAMEATYRLNEMKPREIIMTFVRVFVWAKRNNVWIAWYKRHVTKCAISAVLVYPMQQYMNYASEKWNWSSKRTVLSTMGVLFGVSFVWSLSLMVLKRMGIICA